MRARSQWQQAQILWQPGSRFYLHIKDESDGQRVEAFDTAEEMGRFLAQLVSAQAEPASPAPPAEVVFSAGAPLPLAPAA